MGRTWKTWLAAAGAAMLTLGVAPWPAHAAPQAVPAAPAKGSSVDVRVAAAECYWETMDPWGHWGRLACTDDGWWADWDGDHIIDEVFGVAPGRTIWHSWRTSGGWRQMPNNGRADYIHNVYRNGRGQRQVEVGVWNGSNWDVWYSYYHNGAWRGWYYYPGS